MHGAKLAAESASSPLLSAAKRAKNDRLAFPLRADLQNHAIGQLPRRYKSPWRWDGRLIFACLGVIREMSEYLANIGVV